MRWHDFIFSEEKKIKVLRHFVFWSSWWLYFLLCFFLFQQPISGRLKPQYLTPGNHVLLKTFLLVSVYAIACYPLLYFILPKIIRGKWLIATGSFILLCVGLYFTSHYLYWVIFSTIDSSFGSTSVNQRLVRSWPAVNLGLMNFIKVATAAVIIKYLKYWWVKQKESQRLEKEKINTELQLLKAQIHPDFLFKTLNNIYIHAQSSSPRTSGMLLKLSDLLSYMLYECDKPLVPLDKEIAMMKEYMLLEKTGQNDKTEMEVNLKGNPNSQMIAPFILVPFIENSFKYSDAKTEQPWINMDISINGNAFTMKLANGLPPENNKEEPFSTTHLINVKKRLSLLYPQQHELRISREQEMLIVLLKIELRAIGMEEFEKDNESGTVEAFATLPTFYATQ